MAGNPPKVWQELGDEFHMMIGEYIAAWAQVDDELFRIFQDCIGPLEQSAIIYYRTPGISERFGLTDEIVLSVFPKREKKSGGRDPAEVKAWKAAKDGYGDLLSVRRRIAHHPTAIRSGPKFSIFDDVRTFHQPPSSWFEIYVNQHERLRERSSNLKALRIHDLRKHLIATMALRDRLRRFFLRCINKARASIFLANSSAKLSEISKKEKSPQYLCGDHNHIVGDLQFIGARQQPPIPRLRR
jgi:hypothetical protein